MSRLPVSELPPTSLPVTMTRYAPTSDSTTAIQRVSDMRSRQKQTRKSSVIIGTSETISEAAEAVVRCRPECSKKKYTVMPSSVVANARGAHSYRRTPCSSFRHRGSIRPAVIR